jgi:biotin-dependent carboxylase-like uncharacterized protein
MDEFAYFLANKLLDNNLNEAVLEICFASLELESKGYTTICITGADISLEINGVYKKPWHTYHIKENDTLKFTKFKNGLRAYLAVKGGFILKREFGSYSTTIKEKLGGIDGRALKKNDILYIHNSYKTPNKALQKKYIPTYSNNLILRVILSYQEKEFSQEAKNIFFSKEFILSNEINRMGVKLIGKKITHNIKGIISEGIAFGSIQITSAGEPIILLKDRQTIGGYPKIGTVLSVDCFKLSQAKPNTKIRFQQIDLNEATQITKKFYSNLLR